MKTNLLYLVFFILLTNSAFAQIPFEKLVSTVPSPPWYWNQSISFVGKKPNGGYLGVGSKNEAAPWTRHWSIVIWRFNSLGETIGFNDLKPLIGSDTLRWLSIDATFSSTGELLVLYKSFSPGPEVAGVAKIDELGNIIWRQPLGTPTLHRLKATPDGGCVVVGATSVFPTSPYVIKLDAAGNTQWSNSSFPMSYGYNKLWDIALGSNGTYFVTGLLQDNPANKYQQLVSKLNSSGGVIWNKVFNSGTLNTGDSILSEGTTIEAHTDGGCIVSGQRSKVPGTTLNGCFIQRLDVNGNIVWDTTLTTWGIGKGHKLLRTNTNHYMLFYSTNYGFTDDEPILAGINLNNGSLDWKQIGNYNRHFNIKPVFVNNDNSIIFAGMSNPDGNYGYFIHTTQSGLYRSPSPYTPINESTNLIPPFNLRIHRVIHWFENYSFQVATDSLFTQLVKDITHSADTFEVDLNNMLPNTKYYWRVRGNGTVGQNWYPEMPALWSNLYSFKTGSFIPTSLPSAIKNSDIEVFPNPAYDILQVKNLSFGSVIRVYDVLGKLIILTENDQINKAIDVSSLKSGVYVISIINSSGTYTERFIINK